MQLLQRQLPWLGSHRSGWRKVLEILRSSLRADGMLLDDFAEASFSYAAPRKPHLQHWIGIFHHPNSIKSPLTSDLSQATSTLLATNLKWEEAKPHLHGAIALSEEVASYLRGWLAVPILAIKHPTETDVRQWDAQKARAARQIVQPGFFLRNIRLVFQIDTPGWHRIQLRGSADWYLQRDRALSDLSIRPEYRPETVRLLGRRDDDAYDALLAKSVVVTELYGASANNLVVECMVRGTPLIVNRLPAVEEYLGTDYPLFYDSIDEIAGLLIEDRLQAASKHLLTRAVILPTFDEFAEQILRFAGSIEQQLMPVNGELRDEAATPCRTAGAYVKE